MAALGSVSWHDGGGFRRSRRPRNPQTLYLRRDDIFGSHTFRKSDLTEKIGMGTAKVLTAEAKAETETHEVRLERLLGWLESSGKTPKEQAVKRRLRWKTTD